MIVTDLSNSFNPVPKKKTEKKKEVTTIKKKSKKLAKLERQRDKNLVKEGICEFCGNYSRHLDPHEVYGGSNRKRSIQHKFVKLICPKCHSNEAIINQLRIDTQKEYEKTHTRQEFINLIGKSYLGRNENGI
jgi:hypothetical protein|nr:MAG TPA: Protein of unknown function (DUF968) [Caudoviricetes sp.]